MLKPEELSEQLDKAIMRKEDLNELDNKGYAFIHYAAKTGSLLVVDYLILRGVDIDKQSSQKRWVRGEETALMLAAEAGHLSVVDRLLKANAKVDQANDKGETAFMLAAWAGHLSVVDRLLEANAKVDQANDNGETALMLAAGAGHMKVVMKLIDAGALVNTADHCGFTPLICASQYGQINVVRKLIDIGASVDIGCGLEKTALMHAAWAGHLSVVERLLEANAKVDQTDEECGATALIYAVQEEHIDVVMKLIQARASVDMVDVGWGGQTALISAVWAGNKKIINALINAGADHRLKDKNDKTAMDHAKAAETPEIAEYLQKCINDHHHSVLEERPAYQELFKEIPVCPISLMPITHLICAQINGATYFYEKEAIAEWLSKHNTCPITRKPLSIIDYLSKFSENAEEQTRIDKLWSQVDKTYTEYKQSQLAKVSVFAEEGNQTSDSEAGPARGVKRDCDASDGSDKRPKL